jgi:hypothetical protein
VRAKAKDRMIVLKMAPTTVALMDDASSAVTAEKKE